MSIGFSELGLLLIATAWFVQAFGVGASKKGFQLSRNFVLIYVVGVGCLLLDGLMNFSKFSNILNLLSFLAALIVLFKFNKR